ncbi:hypothetical protein [Streptomyces sp. CB02009]|uniref:hypothetical protein n=1 Tax=Streptomyces sp. CB02009 TaxID=1703938 RepID=UPI001F526C58|nr:hypothetical protein [Streptomyces sp. CB02009]
MYALEENTALVVDNPGTTDERLSVLGPNGVAILDLRQARARTTTAGWSVRDARYSYLTDGDRYLARSWSAFPARDKKLLIPRDTTPVPVNRDVFFSAANPDGRPYAFRTTARELAARVQVRATATTYETGPGFTVTLTKPFGFTAWSDTQGSPQTLIGLRVGIAPN